MSFAAVLANISNIIIPAVIFYVVAMGLVAKKKVYEDFVKGATDGFHTVIRIMPTLIGLMVAVGILRASGFLDLISMLFRGFTDKMGLPAQLMPLIFIRMFSSSAATGFALDMFREYGTDSYIGTLTSLLLSCTDTMLILRGNEEYLQRQDLEFVLIKRVCPLCTLSPVVLDRQS